MQLHNSKILVTGATGQLAHFIVSRLAPDNTVHTMARFGSPGSMDKLEAIGATCIKADYASDDLSHLDDDYDYVLHFATYQVPGSEDFEEAIRVNAVGTGKLMHRFARVKAFFFSSTCSVYQPQGAHPLKETDPLGDSMRGFCPTYAFSKVAAEAVVKFTSEQFGIPAVIARMNVSYGQNGGLPVLHLDAMRKGEPIYLYPDKPNFYNPIHEEDYFSKMLELLDHAASPPPVVNWCGSQTVSAEEWCEYMSGLLGVEPKFVYSDQMIPGSPCDTTFMHELVGETRIDWREGMRRLVEEGAHDDRAA
ncbi:NAD-dependent epimerase/dehydratase family protein [Candidatus Litorirhabdus singularis]|nr:NAD(P)-dependent oxidoreductase [Candidatus Litorirhabdus singularis]